MNLQLEFGDIDRSVFLQDYWQREPLVLRQAFPGFQPPLDENDIAGLACEDMVESRLVTGDDLRQDWQLRHGPFQENELTQLPDSRWTLLVQDVEKHVPELQSLMLAFDFLPCWRLDDLMISVAAAGGSVGPHVDQYDVFLLQASGRRRWQLARTFESARLPDCDLDVLQTFEAEQEWVLEPGDILYLPPGVAHHGVALDLGMTWSIGMRAPSSADLLQAMGEWLAIERDEGQRYSDAGISAFEHPGLLDEVAVRRFRTLLQGTVERDDFQTFLGSFLARYRLAHEPVSPPTRLETEALQQALKKGQRLRRNPWTRLLWQNQPGRATLFTPSGQHSCTAAQAELICDDRALAAVDEHTEPDTLSLVTSLINEGHLYLETL